MTDAIGSLPGRATPAIERGLELPRVEVRRVDVSLCTCDAQLQPHRRLRGVCPPAGWTEAELRLAWGDR